MAYYRWEIGVDYLTDEPHSLNIIRGNMFAECVEEVFGGFFAIVKIQAKLLHGKKNHIIMKIDLSSAVLWFSLK